MSNLGNCRRQAEQFCGYCSVVMILIDVNMKNERSCDGAEEKVVETQGCADEDA